MAQRAPGYEPTSFLVSVLRTGVPFGIAMTALFFVKNGLEPALVSGPPAGLLFGLALATFVKWQSGRLVVRTELLDGERVLYQGGANHWRGKEGRGGWLVLTERALVFRSHGYNLQNVPVRIELGRLRAVVPYRSAGVFANGLQLELLDGSRERFVVNRRHEWMARIKPQTSA